ncbi:hypothetical protein QBC43DRAFT_373101 [Cladorrhinum sp. PSN259]|nr:hypothetical protein QBC43DRAFT_373101 [Cladorrhinum sp. PSN259]
MARTRKIDPGGVVMLVRTRVPLSRPLPPALPAEDQDGDIPQERKHEWETMFSVLMKVQGCQMVACGRVAEDPEIALFAITWQDLESADQFCTSPAYDSFLAALDSPSVETVKFTFSIAADPDYLRGWLSFFTVSLPLPITAAQRELYGKLRGPQYPSYSTLIDPVLKIAMMSVPIASRVPDLQHGWAQAPRQILGIGEVQDGIILRKWLSSEAEQAWRTWIPGAKPDWQDELREVGAVEAKEEHVNLAWVASF